MSVDELRLLSIDAALFSLRIVHSKSVGSENNNDFFLLLLVLLGMHLKEIKKKIIKFLEQ